MLRRGASQTTTKRDANDAIVYARPRYSNGVIDHQTHSTTEMGETNEATNVFLVVDHTVKDADKLFIVPTNTSNAIYEKYALMTCASLLRRLCTDTDK